ncbi:MAG: YfhO family protein [Erysipelotrichales bacterium]|nr:YfhO family protein [Erysipelotrichales bacterium]
MKNRFINMIRNNKLYVCSFIFALIVISILYKLNNVTPFGDRSLLCVDFYHQYGPMLGEFYDRMHGNFNFIYSFNMAMGLPFFRNFLNYLSSPFNIIMMLFTKKGILTSFSFIIGLKAVASCVTFVYYLSKKYKRKELYLIPLGIIYAFQAYFSAYYWNIMWLDGMVFLPLITLGIERIVNDNKWKFYTITLAIMLIANYFIGYMICIFSVVYFLIYNIYKLRIKKGEIRSNLENFIKKCFIFGASSILAGMLTFVLLLPMASSMASISATGGSMPTSQYYDFKLVDFLKSHLTGVSTTVFASDEITPPNISCGILSVALLLAYLINLEIPTKNKLCYLLLLGFFIGAFFIPQLDYILHAFHVPNDLPYRYSFIYSFVLLLIGSYALINIKKIKFPLLALGYVIIIVMLLSIAHDNWTNISTNMIYINMIILTLYFIFYSGIYFVNYMNYIFYIAITIVACIDVIVSINYNWDISQDMNLFYQDYDETKELLEYVKDQDSEKFYRIENTRMMTLNDSSWYDYYGMTTFSSMAYESMAILQHNLGMPGNEINSYYYVQSTPIYDLMFDIKYFIGDSNDTNRYFVTKTIAETANEFTFNVGLGFGVNKSLKNWDYTNTNPFKVQNDFIEKTTNVSNVLLEANLLNVENIYKDTEVTILKYSYENPSDNLYFYSRDSSIKYILIGDALYYNTDGDIDLSAYPDELTYSHLDDYNEEKVININSGEEEITIYVVYSNYYSKAFNLYYIDHDKFKEAYNKLINNKFDITKFKEHSIEGNIYLDYDMDIYTSIPYDEGWIAYVDGKEVETYAVGDALLAIVGTKGKHNIKLVYKIPHLKLGLSCSIFAALVLILDTYINERKKKKIEE